MLSLPHAASATNNSHLNSVCFTTDTPSLSDAHTHRGTGWQVHHRLGAEQVSLRSTTSDVWPDCTVFSNFTVCSFPPTSIHFLTIKMAEKLLQRYPFVYWVSTTCVIFHFQLINTPPPPLIGSCELFLPRLGGRSPRVEGHNEHLCRIKVRH